MLGEDVIADPAHPECAFLASLLRESVAPENRYGEDDSAALKALALPSWRDAGVREAAEAATEPAVAPGL